ncbi:hypothetical protein Tco_0549617 [Tanacetum coccineum]
MSGPAELNLSPPTSAVRNTVRKRNEKISKNLNRPASDAALQEYYDKHYHQLLPIVAENIHQEKVKQEKLKEMKARREEKEEESREYSIGSERTESIPRKRHHERTCLRRTEMLSESEDSEGGHWKSKSKKQRSSIEDDDLLQPRVCEEIDPFTSRIRYFNLSKKTRMPNNVKTYDGSDDLKDHLKIFQAAAKLERWAMPTWYHMFNSTLTGSPGYEIHHIKQSEGESTEDFMQRFKAESRHVKGALECMRISGFMHGITNPELIKRLHDNIPKSVDEMMRVTTTFLKEEVTASNQARKKTLLAWKQQEAGRKQNFDRMGDFRNQQISERRRNEDGTEGPMIIEAEIRGHFIHRIYVDGGSATEILYEHCFNRLRPEVKNQMVSATAPLIGFNGEIIGPMGQILLPLKIGDAEHFTSTWMNFVVVRSPSLYNGIIGRPRVRKIQAVPSTAHRLLKFLVSGGILTLRSSRIIPLELPFCEKMENFKFLLTREAQ